MCREGVLAVDIGTSGARAAVVSADGAILSLAETRFGFSWDEGTGWAEQDPDEVFRNVLAAIQDCCAGYGSRVQSVAVASAMHSLMLLDHSGRPMTPLTIWADRRAVVQCLQYRQEFEARGWQARTGCPLSAAYPLARLLWYRDTHPELFRSFWKAVSIKSYVLLRLTGECVEDHAIASGTGMLNLLRRSWEPEVLDYIGISAERLPEDVPVEAVIFRGEPVVGAVRGVGADTIWLGGGADGPLGHLAAVGGSSVTASLSLGTSAAARLSPANFRPDQLRPHEWCYVMTGARLVVGRASNNGGGVLEWCRKAFGLQNSTLEQLDAGLQGLRPDPQLLFVPRLYHEREDLRTDRHRAGFVGIAPGHGALDLLLAATEAVVFNAVRMLEDVVGGRQATGAVILGGATRLRTVREILAALLAQALPLSDCAEASLRGAGVLAWAGLGVAGAVPRCRLTFNAEPRRDFYRRKYELWRECCGSWWRAGNDGATMTTSQPPATPSRSGEGHRP